MLPSCLTMTGAKKQPSAVRGNLWVDRAAWIVLALAVLFVVAVRVRLRPMPLERDEGEYAYAGQLMLEGIPPYKLAYNMKLPGTYAAYAVIMAAFGQTPSGIHLGLALVNVATIVMLFFLGRRLLDPVTGAVAALAYALLSTSPALVGTAGHATHFVVLFAVGGLLLLQRACLQLSGRLGGAEMARCEKGMEGSIPLSTLRAKVDYGFTEASTPQGNIGIKVWVNNGDYVTGEINDTTDASAAGQRKQGRRRRG